MNDYSTLFTSGLMLLCDSTRPRSHIPPECSPTDDCTGLRSFLSLDMAESLRTFAASSSSPRSSRPSSRKPSSERRSRVPPSPAASSSKLDAAPKPRGTVSPVNGRRRSLPQAKPAPLAELPVLPTATHTRSRSDSAASAVLPMLDISTAPESETTPGKGKSAVRREHLAPITSSLKLELSSAPTTPGSRFPTTPTSSRAISMFSPLTPPSADQSWFPNMDPTSPTESWPDAFAAALSPTLTEGVLGLHFPNSALGVLHEGENVAPLTTVAPKRARVRRGRHSAPSRNASVSANSMRSSQASVTTSYRRAQRGGALARLEGRIPRSEWMSDEEEGLESAKYKSGLSLMPSMDFQSEYSALPTCSKPPFRSEDQNRSFIDLTDDVASLAARRAISSFAV